MATVTLTTFDGEPWEIGVARLSEAQMIPRKRFTEIRGAYWAQLVTETPEQILALIASTQEKSS